MGKNKVMKNIFSESSIARKLWVWFLIVAAVPLMIVGLLTNYNSIETIKTEVSSRLNSVAENKTELINNYFKWRLEDVKILSENLSIIEASEKFTGVFEKHGLKSSEYKVIDKEFRRFLTYHKEGRGYSDILFISKAGDVVFTLMHKPDFGTNLITGPYKDSELANVFSNAYTLMETEVSDFKYYPPSAEPVSFIASPVRKEGKLIAVIAFQIDTREMNKLAQDFTGLGETGEIVISSKTKNGAIVLTPLRNDLYTAFKRIIPIGSVRGIPSQKAVQGQRGSGIFEDYRGVEVLAVWRYLPYLRWGVVVKIDVSEAYTPIYKLTIRFLTVGIISVFVLLFVSFFLSKSISKPIKRLQEGVEIISTGNLNYVVGITTKDEIGQLSRSFDKMVVNLKNINADLTKEITERKKAEEDLRESEGRVRAKLDAILLPEGDIGTLELADIFDIPAIQRLMNDFFTVTHFATALLDLQGKVLVATGWQDICTKFHRVHPETAKHCAESDTLLTEGVEPGTFKKYRCKNNMLDIVTPITMDGKHVGNLFLGQFLFEDEPLDYELFRDQARRYGFDEQEYIAAYERVSRWSREKVDAVMSFYMKLAELISKLSHGNIKLVRTLTERDRFMGSLRESEKRYRNLVENAPDIIYSLAEDGSIISLNPAFERITGWSCSEWLGKPFMTLIHPSDLPLAIESFKQSLGGKNQPPYELRVLSKSGEYLVGEFTSTPLIEKDKVIGEFGIARDITERKRAEDALHLSQITYQGIFDSVTDAIYLQDEEGNFLDVNRAAELMYGYPREYFIGKTPEFLSAPGKNDFSKIAENIRKAYEGEPQLLEFWGIREDGYVFPKDVRLSPGTYFGKKVVIAVARDITERKRTELERHAMFEIIQGVTITDNLDELLQLIHQALKKVLYAENCFIALYNHNTGLFSFPYFVDQFDTAPAPQALEKSCTSYVFRTGRPMSITEELFQQLKEQGEVELVGTPSPSWLGVPLRTPSETIGVLVVQHYEDEHAYTKRDVEFFASVGNQIALAIERKQAENRIKKINRIYVVLSNINQTIVRTHDVKQLFNEICRIAIEDGKFKMSWIGMVNPQTNKVDVVASAGHTGDYLNKINIDLSDEKRSQGLTGRTVKSGVHHISGDIANDGSMLQWREDALRLGYRSAASFPIKVFGIVQGVFNIYSSEVDFFDEDEIRLLDELTMDISFALEFMELEAERKRAEEALRESEERLRIIAETTNAALYRLKYSDMKYDYINPAIKRLIGYSPDEINEIGFASIVKRIEETHGKELEADVLRSDREKGMVSEFRADYLIRTKGGDFRWLTDRSFPWYNESGTIIGSLGILTDISERKEAELEILFQKNRFAQLFENSPIAIALIDDQDKIVQINESFSALFGYFLEEIRGKFINDLIVPPELKEEAKSYSDQTLEGNQINKESYRKRKDGSNVFVQIVGIPVIVNEKTVGIYGMYVDLTQRKNAEEEIIKAKELAEEANRLKSGFLSAMSHEIRTPINTIIGFNSVIRDIFEDAANGEQKMFFDAIENGSLRLLNTITQILDISRIEANEFNIELISMSINKVIESVYRQVKILADKKKLGINLLLPETDVKVIADDYCLNGVLMNILSNAIKYSKKGTIEVKLEEEKDHAVCTIKDEGIGMSEGYQKHLYQSFSQEDVGFSRRYEGTGLGLALIKKYIDLMNGAIDVESKKGVGTTVTIIIPLDK